MFFDSMDTIKWVHFKMFTFATNHSSIMSQNHSNKIRDLIADNQLEEALDVLIGVEQNKGQQRYHTLVLLKGKLDMLEEQEMAGMLDFDELSRQKMRIAHSILKMSEDENWSEPVAGGGKQINVQKNAGSGNTIFKYLFFGVLGLAAVAGIFYMMQPAVELPSNDPPAEEVVTETDPPKEQDTTPNPQTPEPPAKEDKPTLQIDPKLVPQNKITTLNKDQLQQINSDQLNKVIKANDLNKKVTNIPTIAVEDDPVLLSGFPNAGQTYPLGDTKFVLTDIVTKRLPASGTAAPERLELRFKLGLNCRTNLDKCDRPSIVLLMDDAVIKPTQHSRSKDWLAAGSSVTESLTYIFEVKTSSCRIKLEKYGSPWVRGFKIMM